MFLLHDLQPTFQNWLLVCLLGGKDMLVIDLLLAKTNWVPSEMSSLFDGTGSGVKGGQP